MRLPRDLGGEELALLLRRYGATRSPAKPGATCASQHYKVVSTTLPFRATGHCAWVH